MSVHLISEYRKAPAPKKNDISGERYFCACDSDVFKIMSNGAIHCIACHKRINNLEVTIK